MLACTVSSVNLVVLEVFELGGERHPDFDMPFLRRPPGGIQHVVLDAKVRNFTMPRCFVVD